jgi:hypothetical protein
VAKALDAEYVACDVPLQGRIELPDGSVFDLKVKDNMLLALELATTFAHLKAETKKIKEGTQVTVSLDCCGERFVYLEILR